MISMGLLSVVGVMIAQAEGAKDTKKSTNALIQGLMLATVVAVPVMVLVACMHQIMALTGQDPRVVIIAHEYLQLLVLSVVPVLWFAVLRSFVAANERSAIVMIITVSAVGINYVLTLVLVHGGVGLPALGVAGAGWATVIVSWLMLIALTLYVLKSASFHRHRRRPRTFTIELRLWRELLRIGAPAAGLVAIESGLFAAIGILSGVLGAQTLAAYQIIMGWIGIPFVIALGLAEGTMLRVAHGLGRGAMSLARSAGLIGMGMGVSIVALLVAIPVGFPSYLVGVFLNENDPAYHDVATLTTQLLLIAALFQVFDGLQAVATRALRGLRDTWVPLGIAGIGYWVLGVGGGTVLAFPLEMAAHGLWWGLAMGLIATGTALAFRFLVLTRRAIC